MINARVLIVARDDALAGDLSAGLDRLGWTTVTARGPYGGVAALADLQVEAAIVDVSGEDADPLLARRLKAACAPRKLPVVAVGRSPADFQDLSWDLVLAPPLHPTQIALRLEGLVRAAVAEEEFDLRAQTFAERGATLRLPDDGGDKLRVLCVGDPAPKFLSLSNALQESGCEVVGAFTSYTAFDYLHERPFDGVVLWGGEDSTEALSIAAGMRRNTRLYHVPATLYLRDRVQLNESDVYHRGISDIAAPDAGEVETARRVAALARSYRRQTQVKVALERARGSGLMDAATGLFTRDLFASHLARLAAAARGRNRPLSVCVLKLAERPELVPARSGGWLDRAMPQIGSMVSRLVRAEDTAARLAPEVFALALPATAQEQARQVAERIGAVIGCTAFESGEERPPFVVEFEIGVAELQAGETAGRTLERAAAATLARKAG